MAEIEIRIILRKPGSCIPNEDALQRKTTTIELTSNTAESTVNWRFAIGDARIKLRGPYLSSAD